MEDSLQKLFWYYLLLSDLHSGLVDESVRTVHLEYACAMKSTCRQCVCWHRESKKPHLYTGMCRSRHNVVNLICSSHQQAHLQHH